MAPPRLQLSPPRQSSHTPLNGTRKSMMEPNGEDGATDVEGMGTGTTVSVTLCAFFEQMLTIGE